MNVNISEIQWLSKFKIFFLPGMYAECNTLRLQSETNRKLSLSSDIPCALQKSCRMSSFSRGKKKKEGRKKTFFFFKGSSSGSGGDAGEAGKNFWANFGSMFSSQGTTQHEFSRIFSPFLNCFFFLKINYRLKNVLSTLCLNSI